MNKILITLVMVMAGWMNIQAQTRNSVVMDGGGSGPYKAVMTDDESLPISLKSESLTMLNFIKSSMAK